MSKDALKEASMAWEQAAIFLNKKVSTQDKKMKKAYEEVSDESLAAGHYSYSAMEHYQTITVEEENQQWKQATQADEKASIDIANGR